jgi:hypothetical protein
MNVPRYASQVARLLSSAVGNATPPEGDRARGTATIERAMLARRKGRVLRLWVLAAATFALVASGGIWLAGPVASTPGADESRHVSVNVAARGKGVTMTPGDAALRDGTQLVIGGAVSVSKDGRATLTLSTGTRIDLESESNVRAKELDQHQRFYLSKGALEANVTKLSAGQRFIVETPDTEVEVRGTQFRLEVLAAPEGCAVRTRLHVYEGVVEVRAKAGIVRVGAGERWPEPCPAGEHRSEPSGTAPVDEPSSPHAPAVHSSSGGQGTHRAKQAETPEPHPVSSSALVEQNDLFAQGVAARRRGDAAGAISAYDRLMQKYPSSALVENAMVERMRLFTKGDPGAAREEARRYLARYPSGFARAEAERIAAGSP